MNSNFNYIYNKIFNSEIKEKITKKIENNESFLQWHDFDLSINPSDIDTSINYDEIVQKRVISENIAKLSIDLWRDFDYYGRFTFESIYDTEEYKNSLETLGCTYEEGKWKCSKRPSMEVTTKNIFMYCFYRFVENEKTRLRECPYCEGRIKNFGDECKRCNSSYNEMLNTSVNEINKVTVIGEHGVEYIALKPLNDCRITSVDEERKEGKCEESFMNIEMDNENIYKVEEPSMTEDKSMNISIDGSKSKDRELEIVKNKWKCRKCECLNEYTLINCEACREWKCDKCTMINKCDNVRCNGSEREPDCLKNEYCVLCKKNKVRVNEDKCGECRTNNMKVKVDRVKSVIYCKKCTLYKGGFKKDCNICKTLNENYLEIRNDQWKCCKCGLLQSFDFIECSLCDESRKVRGIWQCNKCSLFNECLSINCMECSSGNDHLKIKRRNIFYRFLDKFRFKK